MKNGVLQSFMWKLSVQLNIAPLTTVEAVRKSSLRAVDIIYQRPLQTMRLLALELSVETGVSRHDFRSRSFQYNLKVRFLIYVYFV
jgi:hypothetical protein